MKSAAVLLAAFALVAPDPARAQVPEGEPRASGALRDPDFGVDSAAFGLERRVEMYQWRRDGTSYSKVWNSAPIDSSGFDPAHRNPARLPVRNRQWWVERVTLDGRPLPLDVVRLLGKWTPMRPGFSKLPGVVGRRFQPEGDGLGSSLNPLRPDVGDIRITWHEFVLPPLAGKVVLQDGAWTLSARAAAAPAAVRPAVDITAATRRPAQLLRPWIIGIAVVSLVGLWFLARALTGGKS